MVEAAIIRTVYSTRAVLRCVILVFILQEHLLNSSAKKRQKEAVFSKCDASMTESQREILAQQHLDQGRTASALGTSAGNSAALRHFEISSGCADKEKGRAIREEARVLSEKIYSRLKAASGRDAAAQRAAAAVDSADAEFQSGVQLAGSGDTAGAARAFARAVALQPSHALAWSNLGVVRQQASAPNPPK